MKNLIILIIFFALILGTAVFVILQKQEVSISEAEKQQIEAWIIGQDLNQYGEPKDTVYMGGTPLFDEKTGKTIGRYEYILRRHQDRPWIK